MKNIFALFLCLLPLSAMAQDGSKVECEVVAGFNIGGTTPMGLPAEIREIDSYRPGANPAAGVHVKAMLSPKWGVGAGLMYEMKGMKTGIGVRNYHLTLNIQEGDELDTKTGYYTGSIKNTTRMGAVTLPVYAVWKPSQHWQFTAGMYFSYILSRKFTGEVYGGRIRETPLTPLIGITRASYDYADDLNRFDFGFSLGASRRIYRGLSVRANLQWGCLNMLDSNTRKVDINTFNVYLFAGLGYTL